MAASKSVESRTGAAALAFRWLLDEAFASPPQSGLAWLCFLFPLVKPDVQISHPAFSHSSSLRSRQVSATGRDIVEAECLVEMLVRDLIESHSSASRSPHQPTTDPPLGVSTDEIIDGHDRSLIEIAAPAAKQPTEHSYRSRAYSRESTNGPPRSGMRMNLRTRSRRNAGASGVDRS